MKNQHNKIIQFIVFCLFSISCNNKTIDVEKLDTITTEAFDLKRFNDNQKDSVYEYVVNDTIIKLSEESDCYKKELIVDNSFVQTFIYDKTTKSLISKSSTFLGMPIDIWTTYNENGTLTYWKNYDEGFDFTVNDLIVMLKKDLQIDLMDNQYVSLWIERNSEKRFYFIDSYYYLIQIENRTIKVDGKTGAIIADETRNLEE